MFEAARLESSSLICVTIFVKLCKFLFFVFASHLTLCVSQLIFITYKNSANWCSDSRHHSLFRLGSFHFSKMFAAWQQPFQSQVFSFCLFCFLNLKFTDTAKRKKFSWFTFELWQSCASSDSGWIDDRTCNTFGSGHLCHWLIYSFFSLFYFLKHLSIWANIAFERVDL